MRYRITTVHIVDIPEDEIDDKENPVQEIMDNAHWYTEAFEREAWCEKVERDD